MDNALAHAAAFIAGNEGFEDKNETFCTSWIS